MENQKVNDLIDKVKGKLKIDKSKPNFDAKREKRIRIIGLLITYILIVVFINVIPENKNKMSFRKIKQKEFDLLIDQSKYEKSFFKTMSRILNLDLKNNPLFSDVIFDNTKYKVFNKPESKIYELFELNKKDKYKNRISNKNLNKLDNAKQKIDFLAEFNKSYKSGDYLFVPRKKIIYERKNDKNSNADYEDDEDYKNKKTIIEIEIYDERKNFKKINSIIIDSELIDKEIDILNIRLAVVNNLLIVNVSNGKSSIYKDDYIIINIYDIKDINNIENIKNKEKANGFDINYSLKELKVIDNNLIILEEYYNYSTNYFPTFNEKRRKEIESIKNKGDLLCLTDGNLRKNYTLYVIEKINLSDYSSIKKGYIGSALMAEINDENLVLYSLADEIKQDFIHILKKDIFNVKGIIDVLFRNRHTNRSFDEYINSIVKISLNNFEIKEKKDIYKDLDRALDRDLDRNIKQYFIENNLEDLYYGIYKERLINTNIIDDFIKFGNKSYFINAGYRQDDAGFKVFDENKILEYRISKNEQQTTKIEFNLYKWNNNILRKEQKGNSKSIDKDELFELLDKKEVYIKEENKQFDFNEYKKKFEIHTFGKFVSINFEKSNNKYIFLEDNESSQIDLGQKNAMFIFEINKDKIKEKTYITNIENIENIDEELKDVTRYDYLEFNSIYTENKLYIPGDKNIIILDTDKMKIYDYSYK